MIGGGIYNNCVFAYTERHQFADIFFMFISQKNVRVVQK